MTHPILDSTAGTLIAIAAWNAGRAIVGLAARRIARFALRRLRR